MARLSWRARRRLSLLLLLVWLPLYVVVAVTVAGWIGDMPVLAELALYAGLGFLWALPFRPVFRGVSREDPDRAGSGDEDHPRRE
jgi:hypothetical protein